MPVADDAVVIMAAGARHIDTTKTATPAKMPTAIATARRVFWPFRAPRGARAATSLSGVVVSRVVLSARFMRELLDAMNDNYAKWQTREGIRDLPEFGNE
ncbi:MAG: hypothetical protein NVS3B10_11990 [Polyangiales bacterium]